MPEIVIGSRTVGTGRPTYVVAEMSANHNQDLDRAKAIVRAAHEAGADAIKLQTYTPDMMTIDCANEHFRIGPGTAWEGDTLYDLYRRAATPWEWHPALRDLALELGLDFFSTPFDGSAVRFLEELGVPAYKVASFEITDVELLGRIGATGKPVIMSTGMATLDEIEEAVQTLRGAGAGGLALLKCTSAYPAPVEDINLRTIPHLAAAFNVPVGLSDHTLGIEVAVSAVALGATIIEKHLTLSRDDPTPDAGFSLEPNEFRMMSAAVRNCEKALGGIVYGVAEAERRSAVFRRSLFAVEDIAEGAPFSEKNVRSIRPGSGLHPRYLKDVLGRRARHPIARGTPLSWDLVC